MKSLLFETPSMKRCVNRRRIPCKMMICGQPRQRLTRLGKSDIPTISTHACRPALTRRRSKFQPKTIRGAAALVRLRLGSERACRVMISRTSFGVPLPSPPTLARTTGRPFTNSAPGSYPDTRSARLGSLAARRSVRVLTPDWIHAGDADPQSPLAARIASATA
jgi:hypothetical protein